MDTAPDPRQQLHLRIDPELHTQLRHYAAEKRQTLNDAAQELMRAGFRALFPPPGLPPVGVASQKMGPEDWKRVQESAERFVKKSREILDRE